MVVTGVDMAVSTLGWLNGFVIGSCIFLKVYVNGEREEE